jgi:hypothetical protein
MAHWQRKFFPNFYSSPYPEGHACAAERFAVQGPNDLNKTIDPISDMRYNKKK